jgi:hypothetical protein
MLDSQPPFYGTSVFWEHVASWSFFALFVFELLVLAFEEFRPVRRWVGPRNTKRCRLWLAALGICALGALYKADDLASKYRGIENTRLSTTVSKQDDALKEAQKTITQLQVQLKGAQATINQVRGTATKAVADNAMLLKTVRSESEEIQQLGQKDEVAGLALRAEDDDARAFDRLKEYAALPASDPRQGLAESAVNSIVLARNSRPWKPSYFESDMPMQQGFDMLNSFEKWHDASTRRAICDTVSSYPPEYAARKSVIRQLISIADSDPSLNVREAAYRAYASILFSWWLTGNAKLFNSMTPEQQTVFRMIGITVLDIENLKQDWARRPKNFFPE